MKLLLDTHYLIRLVCTPDTLSASERDLIAAGDLWLSAVFIWEMRTKWRLRDRSGRRRGPLDPQIAVAFAADRAITIIALDDQDCLIPLDPPPPHRDPFGEMLLVHAQRIGARLLTRDDDLRGHPLAYSV